MATAAVGASPALPGCTTGTAPVPSSALWQWQVALGRWQPLRAGRSPPGSTEPELLAQDTQELILSPWQGQDKGTRGTCSGDKGTGGTWGSLAVPLGQGCGDSGAQAWGASSPLIPPSHQNALQDCAGLSTGPEMLNPALRTGNHSSTAAPARAAVKPLLHRGSAQSASCVIK